MGVAANSRPQLAMTGPPVVLTTSVRYRADGRNREALENTSKGPGDVEDLRLGERDDDDVRAAHRTPIRAP